MTAGSGSSAVAGGLARHVPVLASRAVEWLGVREGGVYADATFGAGGYSRLILATPGARVIGIDRDQNAVAEGATLVSAADGRLDLIEDRFSNLEAVVESCGVAAVDGVVLDLGVSSMQLDKAVRGFSFRLDGPLDMRMGHTGPDAAAVGRSRKHARSRRHHRHARRRTSCPDGRARHRQGTPSRADCDNAIARRCGRPCGPCTRRYDPSGHPHLPGVADFR